MNIKIILVQLADSTHSNRGQINLQLISIQIVIIFTHLQLFNSTINVLQLKVNVLVEFSKSLLFQRTQNRVPAFLAYKQPRAIGLGWTAITAAGSHTCC